MAIGLLIAVWTNHLLSHDGESFFGCSGMQASANTPQGINYFSAENF